MKKILGISSIFAAIGLIVCIVFGFALPLKTDVPASSLTGYKILCGLEFFLRFLPPLIITGFVVSCSVYFGHNPEGSTDRFSVAMLKRLKSIMICAIIISAVLTICTETGGFLVRLNKEKIQNRPKLLNEYINIGSDLYNRGYYDRAIRYASAALELNPKSREAANLRDKSELEKSRKENASYRFRLYEGLNEEAETVTRSSVDKEKLSTVYDFVCKAQKYYENQEWFNAHYYAELGLKIADSKDPNYKELRELSTKSWYRQTATHVLKKTQDQENFDKKYEGYKALVKKDDLKAYYIFKELYETSADLQRDPDVKFYLEVAENNLKEKYFFIDETLELSTFEDSNDIYFAYPYKDGSVDIIYFKGLSTVQDTGKSVQYLRNLTILSLDSEGNEIRRITDPYAKVLPVDVKSVNSTLKMEMGIDNSAEFVPYVMLNSVGRDEPNTEIRATFTYADGRTAKNRDFLILPVSYDDFLMLEDSAQNPEVMPVLSLFKMVRKCEPYGFISEIYGSTLLNRVLYPLFIILICVLLATFGWNNRIGLKQYFKMSWALFFPLMFVVALVFYEILYFVFKIINFAILSSCPGIFSAIFACLGIYVFCLALIFVFFCSRTTKK